MNQNERNTNGTNFDFTSKESFLKSLLFVLSLVSLTSISYLNLSYANSKELAPYLDKSSYYPAEVQKTLSGKMGLTNNKLNLTEKKTATSPSTTLTTSTTNLRSLLFKTLNLGHEKSSAQNAPDVLCGTAVNNPCGANDSYTQQIFDYTQARVYLFNKIHAHPTNNPQKVLIDDYYCQSGKLMDTDELSDTRVPGSLNMNTEHVWPQSLFNQGALGAIDGISAVGEKKTDLHILAPTTSTLNSLRSSYYFGDVDNNALSSGDTRCQKGDTEFSKLGMSKKFIAQNPNFISNNHGSIDFGHLTNEQKKSLVFEPPKSRKGDMARITFYFALKFNNTINPTEAETLKRWSHEDPVDQHEIDRNNKIAQLEKVRNPFIDYPQLVDLIDQF